MKKGIARSVRRRWGSGSASGGPPHRCARSAEAARRYRDATRDGQGPALRHVSTAPFLPCSPAPSSALFLSSLVFPLVLPLTLPGMGRGARTMQEKKCQRVDHLGVGRLRYWVSNPLSYLATLPAHPVEPRARIDRCRLTPFLGGQVASRSLGTIDLTGPLFREARSLGHPGSSTLLTREEILCP